MQVRGNGCYVFSQTTTRGSTEVPKRLFSPATAQSVTGPLTGFVIRSLQTNSSGKHTVGPTELRIRRVSACFVEAVYEKTNLFSQSDNENRPIKTKPKRLFFATG